MVYSLSWQLTTVYSCRAYSYHLQQSAAAYFLPHYKNHTITTLATIPTPVASSAPGRVHLVFFTFAAI